MSESSQLLLFAFLLAFLPVALLFGVVKKTTGSVRLVVASSLAFILLLTAVLYVQLGAWVDLKIRDDYQALLQRMSAGEQLAVGEREQLLQRMEQRADATNDADYYYLLANEYRANEEFGRAAAFFEKVAQTWPDDPGILAAWAETEFMAQGFLMTPRVESLIDRTLRVDPGNSTALGVLGINAFRSGEYAEAIEYWSRILMGLPPMSPNRGVLQQSIDRASQMMEQSQELAPASPAPLQPGAGEVAEPTAIEVDVSIREGIEASPGAAVFVFVRVPGSPMPLAVQRIEPASLPGRVTLDDSMVMIPGTSLAGMPQLELVARLSQTGQPVASPGDYQVIEQLETGELLAPLRLEIGEPVD